MSSDLRFTGVASTAPLGSPQSTLQSLQPPGDVEQGLNILDCCPCVPVSVPAYEVT